MISRFNRIRKSRLFGAWANSMFARTISLVPLALFALQIESASSRAGRMYIATFAIIASASYALNTVNEAQRFAKQSSTTTNRALVLQSLICLVAGAALLSPLLHDPSATDPLLLLAIATQPFVALARTRVVDSDRYRGAYSSTGLRDAPSAIVALVALVSASATDWLPFSLAAGCLAQWAYLAWASRSVGKDDLSASKEPSSTKVWAVYVALSAVALAAFQPVARFFVEFGHSALGLASYELADRPAYIVALTIAGGVGTELQRRWRDASLSAARAELHRSERLIMLAMVTAFAVAWVGAFLLRDTLEIIRDGDLLILLPLSFAANIVYVLCILRNRLLMACSLPQTVFHAFAAGVVVLSLVCLVARLTTGPYDTVVVSSATLGGFVVALLWLESRLRRVYAESNEV